MEYRQLGCSGTQGSALGLGCNMFGRQCNEAQSADIVYRALDLGINHFDIADRYASGLSEQYVGRALSGRRHEVILATKVGIKMPDAPKGPNMEGLSYRRVIACCQESLRRLGTDYVDVYYMHKPDPRTPLAETLRALDDLVRQGKVRYVGMSNYLAWQVCEALWICDRRGYQAPIATENRYNILDRTIEADLLPFCRAHGVGLVAYSPLERGFLTGKYRPGEPVAPGVRGYNNPEFVQKLTEPNFRTLARLESFTRDHGHTLAELAIAWLLTHQEVSAVVSAATKPEQVEANVAAVGWNLSESDLGQIDEILRTSPPSIVPPPLS